MLSLILIHLIVQSRRSSESEGGRRVIKTMNDFIRNLSFNSQAPFTPARMAVARQTPTTSEVLLSVMRSYDEVPFTAFRPAPRLADRFNQKSRIKNRK